MVRIGSRKEQILTPARKAPLTPISLDILAIIVYTIQIEMWFLKRFCTLANLTRYSIVVQKFSQSWSTCAELPFWKEPIDSVFLTESSPRDTRRKQFRRHDGKSRSLYHQSTNRMRRSAFSALRRRYGNEEDNYCSQFAYRLCFNC